MGTVYDRIGASYRSTRRSDPRVVALIAGALGDACTLLNVGAGTGSYEPTDREVLAVEPSATMVAQRPAGAAPAVRARVEALPFRDDSFDAALGVNTIHHWRDPRTGLRELRRVARRRVLIFLRDGERGVPFWLSRDYLPALDRSQDFTRIVAMVGEELGAFAVHPLPLARDCPDGLFSAYWGRPEQYLDEEVRRNISNFALASRADSAEGLARLRADLASGTWDRRYGHLRSQAELDLGHRLLVAEI